jgi:hypothetical protein
MFVKPQAERAEMQQQQQKAAKYFITRRVI